MNGVRSTCFIVRNFNLMPVQNNPFSKTFRILITKSNSLDFARALAPYRPELVATVLEARREKYATRAEKKTERRDH